MQIIKITKNDKIYKVYVLGAAFGEDKWLMSCLTLDYSDSFFTVVSTWERITPSEQHKLDEDKEKIEWHKLPENIRLDVIDKLPFWTDVWY